MSNVERTRSDYIYEVTEEQKSSLLEIAVLKDQPFASLVLQAIDEFIERETKSWRKEI